MSETGIVPGPMAMDALSAGRAAWGRHAWQEAFDRLSEADAQGELDGDDLERLATAAYFVARPDTELEILERAFRRYQVAGDLIRAAYLAIHISRKHWFVGRSSISSGWSRRARRLIGDDGDTYAHGYLAVAASESAASAGDLDQAMALADRAVAIGQSAADPDLRAFAGCNLGELRIASGQTAEGLALMEEASIAAVNGELSPFTSGITACRMISTCRDLTDYKRASEWIEATERYCDRQSLDGFPGVCRVHRAEIVSMGGEWNRAEAELVRATTELEAYQLGPPQADGYYALGDVRRLKGDFVGAQNALRDANARGRSPQPALALIRLAQGDVRAALTAIETAVGEASPDRWIRARLLPAHVEILLAASEIERARAATDELATLVEAYPSPALEAALGAARGRVAQAAGDPANAARAFRGAITAWREVGAPYEVARVRVILARALRDLGDADGADLELRTAIDALRELGAVVDLASAEREAAEIEARRARPTTARAAFMFTDIVGSTTLAQALGDDAWEALLRWHDEALRGRIERAGGRVVKTTRDGFFAAFESASAAVRSAIAIQRTLRDHRRDTGFAPPVRIGVHVGDATRRGDDYSGIAVHVASRVGALATGGEILASNDTIAEAGDVAAGERRTVEVKGVSGRVTVAPIAWDDVPSRHVVDGSA